MNIRSAIIAVVALLAFAGTATAAEAPVSTTRAALTTAIYVDHQCGSAAHRTCTSYAIAPVEFCDRYGASRVECDFAIWHKDDKWQCDGRMVVQRVNGHVTHRLKDGLHCHKSYRM